MKCLVCILVITGLVFGFYLDICLVKMKEPMLFTPWTVLFTGLGMLFWLDRPVRRIV